MTTLIAALVIGLPAGSAPDPVVSSFAFFGCNRVDQKDWEKHPKVLVGSANAPQLVQTFKDVAALKHRPSHLFAGGDIVMGYADDQGQVLKSQLESWSGLVNLPKAITLVPIPGNHEMNRKKGDQKLPNLPTDQVWTAWLDRHNYPPKKGNGPSTEGANPDHLADDQSRINYSFDQGSTHFVVLNTDTRTTEVDSETGETKIAWIPVEWAKKDLDQAQANPKVKNIFVLGHRNVIDPASSSGDAPIDPALGKKLVAAIEAHSKVRAYVCAHVHAYDLTRLSGKTGPWQVCAGHGGSKLEKSWNPKQGRSFGFVVIQIHRSGTVGVVGYHRPVPDKEKDYWKAKAVPAKPDPEVVIFRPAR